LGFGEVLAKAHARSGLTALREAHVVSGQLTGRAWEAKLSLNEPKTKKDRSSIGSTKTAIVFVKPL
jgi:hypothetical protein